MTTWSGPSPFQMTVQFLGAGGPGISSQLPTPNTLCITQREFAHDVAIMEFWGGNVSAPSLASGTPVYISWGRAPVIRSFYGYVNHASRTNSTIATDNMGRNAVQVTAVGASWPMKESSAATYVNQTSTRIIERIAAQFGLAANVVPHATVWTKQQGGLSYWQFCVQLMSEIGYTFFCNGVELEAFPRNTDPQALKNLTAVYDYRKDPSLLPVFNPTLGSNNPTGGQLRNRRGAGIDPRTNQVIFAAASGSAASQGTVLGTVQDIPLFTETEVVTADSQAQLNAKVQGSALSNQLYLTATAHGAGNAQLSQGCYIFVQNANGSQNGLWFVTDVEHTMSPYNYTVNMALGRDSLGASAVFSNVKTQSPPQGMLLANNTWGSAAA